MQVERYAKRRGSGEVSKRGGSEGEVQLQPRTEEAEGAEQRPARRGHGRKKGTGRGGRARPGPHRRREKAAADMTPEARVDCRRGAAAVASSARR